MTNAKSRLVRIIALALVVLMIVPAALVGCGKPADDANNAAIEEALAAAQAAKDAADKAAADAQAAIDAANKQIEEAKKQAADAQAKAEELDKTLESMKNTTTTAAPATTTAAPAPEVDKVVLDAHIADILQNGESEYNKLYDKYQGIEGISDGIKAAYAAEQQAVITKLFADAYIAILRADTVDYANALVANLAAALDAVPTYSEVVKDAYDAIDFASDKDVIDVVKAQMLVKAAKEDLVYAPGAAQETKDAVNAEIKALSAFGEAELDLVALIATEYYRYTGVELVDADKDAVEEVLYKDIYDEAQDAELGIAAKVIALYVALTAEGELDVKSVVYSSTLEDKVEAAVEAYADYKLFVEDEGAGELYADFCIAFVGAQFILEQEGDYLSAKLAEAEARAKELLVAYEELDEFYADLVEIVDNYYNDGVTPSGATEPYYFTYLDQYEDVADVAAQLEAWVNKYGFEYDDANFEAMMGTKVTDVTYYQGFIAAKAYTDALGVWFAALDAIDDNSLEDALDDLTKVGVIDYAADGSAIKALVAWYYTTTKDGKVVNQGIENAKVKFDEIKAIKNFADKAITTAAIVELLDEIDLDVTKVESLKAGLNAFEADNGFLDRIADINKAIKELDLANLTVEELGEINFKTTLETLATDMKMTADTDAKYGISTKSLNYKLLPFSALDSIDAAKEALVGALLDKAAVIVETYIGWAGAVDSKGYVVYPAGSPDKAHVYKVNPVEITIYSYDLIKSLKDVYDEINIFELKDILNDDEGVKVTNKQGNKQVFSAETVVSMYRQLSDTYYYVAIANLNSATNAIRNSTVVGTYVDAANEWMHKFSAAPKFDDTDDSISKKLYAYSELYGAYGLEYVFVTGDAGKDNKINVYDTTAAAGNDEKTYLKAVEAVNADKYAVYEGSGSSKTLVDFNEAEYKKAVDAKVAEYRTSWYSDASKGYITKAATAAKLDAYKEAIYKAALAYGLYEIEAEFTMAKEDYKVVVATSNSVFQDKNVGTTPVAEVTVYDDKNKVTTLTEAITVKYENGDAVLYYGAEKLADVDDNTAKSAPKFVYTFADAASTIVANCAKLNGIVMNGGTKNTFVKYEQAWFDAILDAEIKNDFYNGRAAVLAEAEAAVTAQKAIADNIGDALIDKLHTEYKNVWNDKLAYSATALDELKGATAAFIDQLENIAAEHK